MIRILHTGDIHLGLGYSGPTPESKFNDICRIMDFIANASMENAVGLVLVGGDLFKDSRMMFERGTDEVIAIQRFIEKITSARINMLIYSGTMSHDNLKAYEVLKELNAANAYAKIVTHPGLFRYEGFNMAVIPGSNRSQAMTREEFKNLAPEEIHAAITSKITDIAQGLRVESETEDAPIFLAAHYTYSKTDTGFDHLVMAQ
ncbi:MAG: hypothetical protein LBK91_07565 [Synergistaceae bacterium]|nr:hypothetical protein [Synergistaceae bacterium]